MAQFFKKLIAMAIIVKKIKEPVTVELANEMATVLYNLRHKTKVYDDVFGFNARKAKVYWEKKADELLERITVNENE